MCIQRGAASIRRRPAVWLAVALILALSAETGRAAQPAASRAGAVTDEQVDDAIRAAVRWIREQRGAEGNWERGGSVDHMHWAGDTALCVLALLYAGVDPGRESWLNDSIQWLMGQRLNGTYTVGVRAHALAMLPAATRRGALEADLNWLLAAVWPADSDNPGCFDYTPPPQGHKRGRWDNSATQFGVLGVWNAADAGLNVPPAFWDSVASHWLRTQNPDGGWQYQDAKDGGRSTGSMTAAGLASLFVVLDQRIAAGRREQRDLVSGIQRGLEWFGFNYNTQNPGGFERFRYYYLYGVERVGRASGYRTFRDRDWFREGAVFLLDNQRPDGDWPSTGSEMTALRNTAFGLMFLCHGRAPLLFNKLEHGAGWDERFRDAAGLARYASATLERLLNWQIVSLDSPPEVLLEAPALYLYNKENRDFSDDEVDQLRDYCNRGGFLFVVQSDELGGARSNFEALARRAFPEIRPERLPADHPLFNGQVQFAIDNPPACLAIHNGVRMLMLLCTRDIADAWSGAGAGARRARDLQLGLNVYLYAADKTPPRSRLAAIEIPDRNRAAARTISVARLKHSGQWDIEPHGWTRLTRYLANEAGVQLLVTSGMPLDSDALRDFKIAHITGVSALELNAAERAGLRRFITGGGTLIADAACGSLEFDRSLDAVLRELLDEEPKAVASGSFFFKADLIPGAAAIADLRVRRAAVAAGISGAPRLRTFGQRRASVVCSPVDLSVSMLGTPVYGLVGYEGDAALRLMRNIILYADLDSSTKAALQREKPPEKP